MADPSKVMRSFATSVRRAAKEARPLILKAVGHEALSLVQIGFRSSIAPDGTPWAPLKRRVGQPLRDTGRLMNSLTNASAITITERAVIVGTNVAYAPYHQGGTRTTPARPFLPESGPLPPAWDRAIGEAAEDAADVALKRLA